MTRLPDLVRRSAQRYPDAVALAPVPCNGHGWSYAHLRALVERGAAFLESAGLAPGDRVLLDLEPCAAWPVALFAILEAGLVAVPLAADTPLATAAGAAGFAGARLAVLGNRTRGLAAICGDVRCLAVEQLLQVEATTRRPQREPFPELALLAFTSGSTREPRAVELTHANLLANLQSLLQVRQAAPGDSFLSMLPPAHLFELMTGLLGPLACGARVVYATSLLPHRVVAALREEHITHALSVPALLDVIYEEVVNELVDVGAAQVEVRGQSLAETARRLQEELDAAERERLCASVRERIGTSFHSLVIGGAAPDPAWAVVTAAVGVRLEVGYGLTEASPIVAAGLASECPPGSVGRPLPGVEVKVDENGEILVRGPNVMRGYFRDSASTAAVLQDGWLRTGDHGRLDDNGFLFIAGRLKEALKTAAGETLYPEEVEPYYDSPLFAERCVAGLPGPHGNDVPTLFVVPGSTEIGEPELRQVFEDLRAAAPPRFRVADMVPLAGPLPRTPIGKVRRRTVAQQWQKRGALS
jgi:long-chain acyl-CoA synthetase